MTGSFVDRARTQRLMAEAGLDALLLFQPEHVAWAVGVGPGVAGMFRRAGAGIALVPADPAHSLAAVMPDLSEPAVRAGTDVSDIRWHPIWVDRSRVKPPAADASLTEVFAKLPPQAPRPATFDARAACALAAEALTARGLQKARVGLDLAFVPVADMATIKAALPAATLLDGTATINRLRMVKTPREIALLRTAVDLSEIGLAAGMAAIRPGVDRADLAAVYADAARGEAQRRGLPPVTTFENISVGPDPWGAPKKAAPGDIVRFDIAVVNGGYASDMARTFSLSRPPRAARELHAALLAALEEGLAMLRPGVPLRDLHARMTSVVRAAGIPSYARGHFGHSVGSDPFGEQWPFISADAETAAEPGMVLAVEAPYYVDGLGGFIVEDQVLVTETGIDNMSRTDRGFRQF